MDADPILAAFRHALDTNVTSTIHRAPYAAISVARPELSQSGQAVLITGGSMGIGYGIAKKFVLAQASKVIIVARGAELLDDSAARLKKLGQDAGSPSNIITRICDVTKSAEVEALWADLAKEGILVDVLVLNSAKFTEPKPLFELGIEEVWSQFEANVKGPLHFVEKFSKQSGEGQKFLINVTTQSIHMQQNPVVLQRPAYALTKTAGVMAAQLIADALPADKLQVVNFHPGLLYNKAWGAMGLTPQSAPFDDEDLPGSFAVWAATKEASFLHGRYVWASWDVTELAQGEVRKTLHENPDFLRVGIVGLRDTMRA